MDDVDKFAIGFAIGALIGFILGVLFADRFSTPASIVFERDESGRIVGIHYVKR